jgi:hypothetical protein
MNDTVTSVVESHNYPTYFIGSLRVVLGVEVLPGKQHSGKHSRPGLWRLIDGLPVHCRPRLIRGDVSYGSEEGMTAAEVRRQLYLFKLRQTTKVQKQIRDLERDGQAWADAGDGWQGAEGTLKLNRLAQTAEKLSVEAIWAIILSAAFVQWLRGKGLRPVMHGDQVLLHLPA